MVSMSTNGQGGNIISIPLSNPIVVGMSCFIMALPNVVLMWDRNAQGGRQYYILDQIIFYILKQNNLYKSMEGVCGPVHISAWKGQSPFVSENESELQNGFISTTHALPVQLPLPSAYTRMQKSSDARP